jgi:hypothetical protein
LTERLLRELWGSETGVVCREFGSSGVGFGSHARHYWLLLAESQFTRRLFAAMVRRIAALPAAPG